MRLKCKTEKKKISKQQNNVVLKENKKNIIKIGMMFVM